MAVLIGIFLGLTTLLFIGPVFFYLLKSSIENGFKAGIAVAIGIILGDIIYVVIVTLGMGKYMNSPEYLKWFALIGGLIILFFGINYLFFSGKKKEVVDKFKSKSLFHFGLNGFLINFVNPFVLAVWIGFYTYANANLLSESKAVVAMVSVLVVIFTTDILKAYYANKISKYFTANNLKKMYQVFGIIMIGFSIRLFYEFFKS